jgi:mannose-6-phosphate isomerase-like protein (cupin superfamily)
MDTTMHKTVNPKAIASGLAALWSPQVIGKVDDYYIKVARVQGTFGEHAHADEDELFLILKGSLRLHIDGQDVVLNEGDLHVVPKGVRHNPSASEECLVLLVERKSTLHSGDTPSAYTRSIEEQLGVA